LTVTGDMTAGYLYGDVSNVTGITSNLHQIAENGNVTSNTLQFTNATTGFVTTANVEVGGELTVSSNLTVTGNATVSSNLTVTGNVLVSDDLTVTGNVAVTGTGSLTVPSGTTAQKPTGVTGMVRFNIDTNRMEFYNGTSWNTLSGFNSVEATGGTVTDITDSGVKYRVHTFSTIGTYSFVTTVGGEVEYLIVGGGGGGGGRYHCGGGGGGGVLQHKGFSVTPQTYSIVVGDGGSSGLAAPDSAQRGDNGSNSTAFGQTALGGGGGGANSTLFTGSNGGSGGGGSGSSLALTHQGGNGTIGQGSNGGNGIGSASNSTLRVGGGGGGAGTRGMNAIHGESPGPGHGGDGIPSTISGTLTYYGGGGGGGGLAETTNMGLGGKGGGGNGASTANGVPYATEGENGKGGGGGGSNGSSNGLGHAGSGIVIIRYRK